MSHTAAAVTTATAVVVVAVIKVIDSIAHHSMSKHVQIRWENHKNDAHCTAPLAAHPAEKCENNLIKRSTPNNKRSYHMGTHTHTHGGKSPQNKVPSILTHIPMKIIMIIIVSALFFAGAVIWSQGFAFVQKDKWNTKTLVDFFWIFFCLYL